jgi:hypothetical protein
MGGPPPGRAEPLRLSHPVSGNASGSVREPKRGVNGEPVLGRRFRTHHHERASGGAPGASDRSFVDQCHRTSARATVCDDKHLVLVALRSACGGLAVGARNADGAVRRGSARRPRRTFRALRARRSWWANRSCRTGLALFTRRPDRAGISLGARRALPTACHANRDGDCNGDPFDMHPRTSLLLARGAKYYRMSPSHRSRYRRPSSGFPIKSRPSPFSAASDLANLILQMYEQEAELRRFAEPPN